MFLDCFRFKKKLEKKLQGAKNLSPLFHNQRWPKIVATNNAPFAANYFIILGRKKCQALAFFKPCSSGPSVLKARHTSLELRGRLALRFKNIFKKN